MKRDFPIPESAYLGVVIDSIVQEGRLFAAMELGRQQVRDERLKEASRDFRPFLVLVQDIAHQLRVIANDNTDDDRRERMRLINELVEAADRIVKEGK